MMLWTKNEIIEALSVDLINHNLQENLLIKKVVIDSRKAEKNTLFFAIKGEKNDGHSFLLDVDNSGCDVAIIDDKEIFSNANSFKNLKLILVKETFSALYKMAEFSRKRSLAKIIAVTGSVGKTSVKEMLNLVFSAQGKTFATEGNLNNHFGVPLCLCNFAKDCDFGIFEIGMNHAKEIEPLSNLVRPHLAIITNVGAVHIENFNSEEEIALAKAEIFSGLEDKGFALINSDNLHFSFLEKLLKKQSKNFFSFGWKNFADYQIMQLDNIFSEYSKIEAKLPSNQKISYKISSQNQANIFNSIIAVCCVDLFKKDFRNSLKSLESFQNPRGRGGLFEVNVNQKKITVIDDSYNASIISMRCGLENAVQLKKNLGKKRLIVALGDMLELGKKSVEMHDELLQFLSKLEIDFAILVGEKMIECSRNLATNFYKTFLNSSLAANEINNFIEDGDIIYIKGSRGIKMEKIIENLNKK
jgi:UDP-N-acetylmuramoyl-tripeptide--D-alanyl-D-alanine ligase